MGNLPRLQLVPSTTPEHTSARNAAEKTLKRAAISRQKQQTTSNTLESGLAPRQCAASLSPAGEQSLPCSVHKDVRFGVFPCEGAVN